jgi:asparagine synthase (glutamine-hydrolysing)
MLDVPSELVGDDPDLVAEILSARRDVDAVEDAATLFETYFQDRFAAAVRRDHRQFVMLSGGVDSIVTLAALVRSAGPDRVEAVTVGAGDGGSDLATAAAVAAGLGVRHTVLTMSTGGLVPLTREIIGRLGVDELWEVAAALVVKTVFDAVPDDATQVWSGDGGDELLAGGLWPNVQPPEGILEGRTAVGDDPTDWFASCQRHVWLDEWSSNRLVPDFFERVIPGRTLWRSMATEEACRLAARLRADAVWGLDDKEPLRVLAERLGVPRHCARKPKGRMQASSGVIDVLVAAARQTVSRIPRAGTYRDTDAEPLAHSFVRLWLHQLPPASR